MPAITGTIDHRILLNYRIDPVALRPHLPPEFRPLLVSGFAIGGICQVSLSGMRPSGLPALGFHSHNAAHRIAVRSSGGSGVFVSRRDTDSWLNAFSGGRLFPGVYNKAAFTVDVLADHYVVNVEEGNGAPLMHIDAEVAEELVPGSVFKDVDEVSDFFQLGNVGWSAGGDPGTFDAIELEAVEWRMEPMEVNEEFSSYFSEGSLFPSGSVEFDSAMIMRDVRHRWVSRDNLRELCC